MREAARNLGVCNHTISAYIKTGKLLKDIYLITKKLTASLIQSIRKNKLP